eukprot:6394254-Prymnesium_polylepis.1
MPAPWALLWRLLAPIVTRPWRAVSITFGFVFKWQEIKDIGQLSFLFVSGQSADAGCRLCDLLTKRALLSANLDSLDGSYVNCASRPFRACGQQGCSFSLTSNQVCFGFGQGCRNTCERITGAMKNSTDYPCEAAGFCPPLDEFGEVSCRFDFRKLGCTPASQCKFTFPNKCEIRAGRRLWKKATKHATEGLQAIGAAFHQRVKYCSEPDAGPHCKMEAEGTGRAAQVGGYLLLAFRATTQTFKAIETPGGGDDRQWLTFWVIMFGFTFIERFTDLLLSRVRWYYELKLALLLWMLFSNGAEKLYRRARRVVLRSPTLHLVLVGNPVARTLIGDWAEDPNEEQIVEQLPRVMHADARLATRRDAQKYTHVAPTAFLEQFSSDAELADHFMERDPQVVGKLWRKWNHFDPRFLVIELVSAEKLPQMDEDGDSSFVLGVGTNAAADAYVVAALLPPTDVITADATTDSSESSQGGSLKETALNELISAFRALTQGRPGLALWRLQRAKALLFEVAAGRNGPPSPSGSYGHTRTYDNSDCAYTKLRLEVWDADPLLVGNDPEDDFIGEVTIALAPLMDQCWHEYDC